MSVGISDYTKEKFVRSIQKAMGAAKFHMIQKNTPTNIGGPNDKWDFIIKYIYENMDEEENYLVGIIHGLGPHKPVFVYDSESQILFSILRDTNYKTFLKGNKKITYYVNSALSFNKDLPRIPGQIGLFDNIPSKISEKEADVLEWKKSLITNHVGIGEEDVKYYITIVFREKDYVLENVMAYLTNSYYEPIKPMNWSQYILPDIEDISTQIEGVEEKEQDLLIGIKDGKSSTEKQDDTIQDEQSIISNENIAINLKESKKSND